MKLIAAQLNPIVGDVAGNTRLVLEAARPYADESEALIVYPELIITGYPPEDLLGRPDFVKQVMQQNEAICEASQNMVCSLLFGTLWVEDGLIYNAALLVASGKVLHIHKKNSLPNYGVFDERRYFAQGSAPIMVAHLGQKIGVLICEDGWFAHNFRLLKAQGAEHVLVINASPFEVDKQYRRHELFKKMAADYHLNIFYVNMAGAQDDLVFDGASFAVSPDGIIYQISAFDAAIGEAKDYIIPYPEKYEQLWRAIGSGLENYLHKNNIQKVVLGISGGLDSSIVATLAADVLGAEHVHGVMLPSTFTSKDSNEDAAQLAKNLGISTSVLPIEPFMQAAEQQLVANLADAGANVENWRENLAISGNLQARLRGNMLMAYSNALGAVVLNTSNKSELAVGYSTMYGDACGAYSPLKDIYKSELYELAKWRNANGAVIPENVLTKAPTAELRSNQKDTDQLPEYAELDQILHALIEERLDVAEIVSRGFDEALVQKIYRMLRAAEYKRRQFPPGPKVSPMLFGRDWRYPLTNGYGG